MFTFVLFFLLSFFLGACDQVLTDSNLFLNEKNHCSSEELVVGTRRNIPFNPLNNRNNSIKPNYVYFRIRTNNIENIEIIEQLLGDLNTVPLEYTILEGGCVYPDNKGTEEFSPWFYSMTLFETYNKVKLLGDTEIFEEIYLSDDDLKKFTEVENDFYESNSRFLWFNYKKARPCGYVYFYDEVKEKYCPLKNVKVTVSQWCHVKSVYTNDEGYYDIGENFTTCWQDTASVKITFESHTDSVYDQFAVANAYYKTKDTSVSNLKNNNIRFTANTKQNNYGIIINAATEYRRYAREDKITEPSDLKFWACSFMNGGLTLMRDVIIVDSAAIGAIIGTGVAPGAGTTIGTITGAALATYFPDILISLNYEDRSHTEGITETVFHEMAHASHFYGIGTGSVTYWNKEYLEMLGGWCEVLVNGESPFENCYNNGNSKQICHIESWAYFYGYLLTNRYFEEYTTVNNYLYLLEGIFSYNDFIFYDTVYYKLYKDNLLTVSQIFNPYKYFLVQSSSSWYNKLLDLYKDIDKSKIKNILQRFGVST